MLPLLVNCLCAIASYAPARLRAHPRSFVFGLEVSGANEDFLSMLEQGGLRI
jgi:hypothetical protein